MLSIIPFIAFAKPFNSGATTSEYIANWFPMENEKKKYPRKPKIINIADFEINK